MFINVLIAASECDRWTEGGAGYQVRGNGWSICVWEDARTVTVSGGSAETLVGLVSDVKFGNRQTMLIYKFKDIEAMLNWVSKVFQALDEI